MSTGQTDDAALRRAVVAGYRMKLLHLKVLDSIVRSGPPPPTPLRSTSCILKLPFSLSIFQLALSFSFSCFQKNKIK